MKHLKLVFLIFVLCGCASNKQKGVVETFQPILDFMEYKPGMTLADIGSGSGQMMIAMATLMDNSDIYIQDIDTSALNQRSINKFLDMYSKQTHQDQRSRNKLHIVIGDFEHTKLPDKTFDLIYSNATVHALTSFDSMMQDIARKLKPGGAVYLRDSFKGDHNEGEFCSDPKCGNRLLTIDEFLEGMSRNGYTLIKRNPDMSGYPVFGFKIAR